MSQYSSAVNHHVDSFVPVTNGLLNKTPFPDTLANDSPSSSANSSVADLTRSADAPPSVQDTQLTLRALVSTKEAGVIIGKGGKNVADLREAANVKAGVSKVSPGIHDRVLSVTGVLGDVANAYQLVAQTLVDNPLAVAAQPIMQLTTPPSLQTVVRILISHNLMGTIIGRQGLKIKHIQDASGARLVATKEMLPQSTERVVEVHGSVDSIRVAIEEIGKCLIDDWERGVGTVLYNPATRVPTVSSTSNPYVNNTRAAADFTHADVNRFAASQLGSAAMSRHRSHTVSVTRAAGPTDMLTSSMPMPPRPAMAFSAPRDHGSTTPPGLLSSAAALSNNARLRSQSVSVQPQRIIDPAALMANVRTQQISIPSDMVGCIIGKNGARISEIRRLSGSRISIAKASECEGGDRLFTIKGTPECNERALYLLYGQLEAERERRLANARLMATLESINEQAIIDDRQQAASGL
ncbi:RNA binding protein, heterogenous nuclear RNP-K like protein [Coemansia erecta]|uniref:RNA binding protein, heterogenous nuclear RNP-K like protein n=1 Tax=Coemansia asiatica TaxID=1052880 RepID=A0A9W7XH20_9FUNG|nr:RNA binding protein, heterogenous nuclear RNP-K like protein [Coemansia asiatica]KAJ2853766.1 RNA binding protein, heterogenous nuclear RNP-K like protein [Coemansia erecta]KAJ2878581.1 RNA binding protein, heterogenous nuclear RNP-K like protein [Coemansia asiatica]